MSEYGKRIKEKVEKDSKRTFFEKIIRYIPIYHGYKVKELRREADRLLREHISGQLSKLSERLKEVRDILVDEDMQSLWDDAEKAISLFDVVTQKVLYADYGYSGFFDAVKINEEELDRMYEFDSSLISDVEVLSDVISELENEVNSYDTTVLKKHLRRVIKVVKSFEDKLSRREGYLNKFSD